MKVLVEDMTESESKKITRDEAWELLNKYNTDPFHLKHADYGRHHEIFCKAAWI